MGAFFGCLLIVWAILTVGAELIEQLTRIADETTGEFDEDGEGNPDNGGVVTKEGE